MPAKRLDFNDVRDLALRLPGVEQSSLHGAPSLKAGGRLFACPALHRSAEPDSVMVRIGFEQRAALLAAEPDVFYVTEHYAKHPAVLVRLGRMKRTDLKKLLDAAWRFAGSGSKASSPTAGSRPPARLPRAATSTRTGSRRRPPSRRGASRRAGPAP